MVGKQLPKQTNWQAELMLLESGLDSIQLQQKIDSLTFYGKRLMIIAEQSPELLRNIMQNLHEGLGSIISAFDYQRIAFMKDFQKERIAITAVLQKERTLAMQELDVTATKVVNDSWTHVREIIKDILLWVIIIVILVLGMPFWLGVLVGRTVLKPKV
jgi:hypothetical protein